MSLPQSHLKEICTSNDATSMRNTFRFTPQQWQHVKAILISTLTATLVRFVLLSLSYFSRNSVRSLFGWFCFSYSLVSAMRNLFVSENRSYT